MNTDLLQKLLIRANKLGAQGYQVIGWTPPESGTSNPEGTLYYITSRGRTGSEKPWYQT